MPDATDITGNVRYVPYRRRLIRFEGLRDAAGHRIKLYSIVYGDGDLDRSRFEVGLSAAIDGLPVPDPGRGRPGLGFAILHQGRTGDYVVLCWWDQENELPTRVLLRDGPRWRPAVNESFCVWDLEVMWFERSAYLDTILTGEQLSTEAYLARTMI